MAFSNSYRQRWHPSRTPKPNKYLHYWYSNYLHDGGYDLTKNGRFFVSKQQLIQDALRRFQIIRQSQISQFAAHNNNQGVEEISAILDYFDNNPNALADELEQFQLNTAGQTVEGEFPTSLQEAQSQLQTSIQRLEKVEPIILNLIKGLSYCMDINNIKAYSRAIIRQYAKDNGFTGKGAQSQASRTIIQDFLNRTNNKPFTFSDNFLNNNPEAATLTSSMKRALALIAAVDISLGKSAHALDGMNVMSKSQGNLGIQSESQVLKYFLGKAKGLTSYVASEGLEIAQSKAVIKGTTDLAKELDLKINSLFKNGAYKTTGKSSVQVDTQFLENSTFQEVVRRTEQSAQRSTVISHQKPDTAYVINDNGIEISLFGSSVKKDFSNVPLTTETGRVIRMANLKLQDSTPLNTLLVREVGLSDQEYHGLIQLLVAQDSRNPTSLNAAWEKIKEYIKYSGLLSAMISISSQAQALYMTIGDRVLPMSHILTEILNGNADAIITPIGIGFGSRMPYRVGNKWSGSDQANTPDALIRSEEAWNNAASLLYTTKITYHLTASNIGQLLKK